ncbi:hypothetical protein EJ08DRAFT_579774 [Tothia fuscella]|uniref:Pyridoxamine 5'-phosphate oxidase N-terminal domain-containing protein n=1 Tax=Tothia fuscella TaxID=1048955 RepID=A0A9P4P2X4_9PEZI|nr:hypothetical protein EJ08DRAFT_579774 [Tothia fuscella]
MDISNASGRPGIASNLPEEVVTCLENARFLHLATCQNDEPHVSLMKYTYLPSTPFSDSPTIIMTTPPSSQKTLNLQSNPKVSCLVHDWISHRPPTLSSSPGGSTTTYPQEHRSSLASMLLGLNTASLSRISVSLNGTAQFLRAGSQEETWCKTKHKENNTFGETEGDASGGSVPGEDGAGCYIEGEEVMVVLVKIRSGRISDRSETVKDFVLEGSRNAGTPMTNGIGI